MERMGWHSRAAALSALAAAAVAAPAALAAQGTDTAGRGDEVHYTADPGEANRFVAEDSDSGIHLHDSGAIIHWSSGPQSECTATLHDVYCQGPADEFGLDVRLGDGADTFANHSSAVPLVHLGPGDDKAVGGGAGYVVDGGLGADDLHGAPAPRWPPFNGQAVVYWNSKRRVTVTADNKANDGARGEHDNVHSDVHEVDGSANGDTIRGFAAESGYGGNDLLQGSRHRDTLYGGPGNDVLVGRGGRDTLMDDRGNNIFRARDHSVDHISCGTGHDTVYADRHDVIEPSRPPLSGPCDVVHVR